MKKFIIQFKKAQSLGEMLIYDSVCKRWLVTNNNSWLSWGHCVLVKRFKK